MRRGIQGGTVRSTAGPEPFEAFVPDPLPPVPPLELDAERSDRIGRANRAIGRLDGMVSVLPTGVFLYQYVRKEAVLSSQIEGTQSSLSDLLLYESRERPGVPLDDVEEVVRYVAALEHGLERIRSGFPISARLLREVHQKLLASGRGSDRSPGEFRRSQNWIGGSRPGDAVFVPPPPEGVPRLVGDLERFLHDLGGVETPLLLKAALAHVQFETIHPFLDGNGRVGRLLITLLLCDADALAEPLLYLSLYFKAHRARYYDLLQKVRLEGDWEAWVDFFLEGVIETAEQATSTARRLLVLYAADRERIEGELDRAAGSALRVHGLLERTPLTTTGRADRELGLSRPTITKALENLARLGIVEEVTGRGWGRVYTYRQALEILAEGTEPLGAVESDAQALKTSG